MMRDITPAALQKFYHVVSYTKINPTAELKHAYIYNEVVIGPVGSRVIG